jgi:hypothetical protein
MQLYEPAAAASLSASSPPPHQPGYEFFAPAMNAAHDIFDFVALDCRMSLKTRAHVVEQTLNRVAWHRVRRFVRGH